MATQPPRPLRELMLYEPYGVRVASALSDLDARLPGELPRLDLLPDTVVSDVFRYLFELACQAQHAANIELGRAAFLTLPRTWLIERLEGFARAHLNLDDEWVARRLLELLELVDGSLLHRTATVLSSSRIEAVREAARDALHSTNTA